MNAKERELEASGRGRVRYIHLIAEWPEGKGLDHVDAMLQAPEKAVIKAVLRDRDHYGKLLNDDRDARYAAEAKLRELEAAIALVLGVAARLSPALTGLADVGGHNG